MPCKNQSTDTVCALEEDQQNFLRNKSIIFAYTNMAIDPSNFTHDPVKRWIDNSLIIPLSGVRHQMHNIQVTPVIFSKEE